MLLIFKPGLAWLKSFLSWLTCLRARSSLGQPGHRPNPIGIYRHLRRNCFMMGEGSLQDSLLVAAPSKQVLRTCMICVLYLSCVFVCICVFCVVFWRVLVCTGVSLRFICVHLVYRLCTSVHWLRTNAVLLSIYVVRLIALNKPKR